MKVSPYLVRHACCVTAIALAAALAVPASAQTVLVDFGSDGSYRGLSVLNPDTNGNYWTSFTQGELAENLIDINNVPTSIDLGLSTNAGQDSYNGPAGATGPADDKVALRANDLPATDIDIVALGLLGGALEAAFDFFASPGAPLPNTVQFEIQELDPTKTYDLTFFGSHSYSNNATTVYSVYTDNTYANLVDSASLDVQDPDSPELHNRDMVATISNLSPQADNILYVEFIGSLGNLGYLNALQIDMISPPALSGDYNGNGVVDAADYTVYRDNLGGDAAVAFAPGTRDPGLSGPIDGNDYAFWTTQFGSSGSAAITPGSSAPVPEPSTLAIVISASAIALAYRKRTHAVRATRISKCEGPPFVSRT